MRAKDLTFIAVQPQRPTMPLPTTPYEPDYDYSRELLAHAHRAPRAVGTVNLAPFAQPLLDLPLEPLLSCHKTERRWIIRQYQDKQGRPTYLLPAPLLHIVPAFQSMLDDLYSRDGNASRYVPFVLRRCSPAKAEVPFPRPHIDIMAGRLGLLSRFITQYIVATTKSPTFYPLQLSQSDVGGLLQALQTPDDDDLVDRQYEAQGDFYERRIGAGQGVSFPPGTIIEASPFVAHAAPQLAPVEPRNLLRVDFMDGPDLETRDALIEQRHPLAQGINRERHMHMLRHIFWVYDPELYATIITHNQRRSLNPLKWRLPDHLNLIPSRIVKRGRVQPAP